MSFLPSSTRGTVSLDFIQDNYLTSRATRQLIANPDPVVLDEIKDDVVDLELRTSSIESQVTSTGLSSSKLTLANQVSGTTELKASDTTSNLSFTLPSSYGSNGNFLTSNGLGGTGWGIATASVLSDANSNTKVGTNTGSNFTTASQNTVMGFEAGQSVTTGNSNVLLGYRAGRLLDTEASTVCIGFSSGMTGATAGIFIGDSAGMYTTGSHNIFIGTGCGRSTVAKVPSGAYNICIGRNGMNTYESAAIRNTGVGDSVLQNVTIGVDNVCMGYQAGQMLTTGNSNTLIGYNANTGPTSSNSMAIGNGATVSSSNHAVIGNASLSLIRSGGNAVCDLGTSTNQFKDIYTRSMKYNGSTSGIVTIQAAPTTATYSATLPNAAPSIDGQVLSTTSAGVTSWKLPNVIQYSVANITSSTTLNLVNNLISVDATAGNITLTLPAVSSSVGMNYTVIKTDASANIVTIVPSTGESYEGVANATVVISSRYAKAKLFAITVGWFSS